MHQLPNRLRVLDVGCGSGVHGAELQRKYQHFVTGVDISEDSIRKARSRLHDAYVADVEHPEKYPFKNADAFDIIVFSDILEHLCKPHEVLRAHVAFLKPQGRIVVSIPNVAIWNVRLELLSGRFTYRETGTLDRTHMRFFDRRSYGELLASAGLQVERMSITPGILRPFVPVIKQLYRHDKEYTATANSPCIMDSGAYRLYCRFGYPVERLICQVCPGLLSFQYVSLCQVV